MALFNRLALFPVTKPPRLGGLMNRRQFSNLTKDDKFFRSESSKLKESSDQARDGMKKLQATESASRPKIVSDQVRADYEASAAKLLDTMVQSRYKISAAFEEAGQVRSRAVKDLMAEIELARKQLFMFGAGLVVFVPALFGFGNVLLRKYLCPPEGDDD